MRELVIPERLKVEFASIEALWHSSAETRRVDSLILAWVKYEKQLRRLFCFLVFQHPKITKLQIDAVISVLARNKKLYPETFIRGITALGATSVPELLADKHRPLWNEIERIRGYRNKLIHGQISGLRIRSAQLERDVLLIIEWISSIAEGAEAAYGYDGIKRNTYPMAKSAIISAVAGYPFANVTEFKEWLTTLSEQQK